MYIIYSILYRASNAILAKLGHNNNKPVTLNLIASVALPALMYSIEALSLNKSELNSLNHPWIRSFEKLFNTFDSDVVKRCQLHSGYLNVIHYYALKSVSFINKLSSSPNLLVRTIYMSAGREDLCKISNLFNCNSDVFLNSYKRIIYESFEIS